MPDKTVNPLLSEFAGTERESRIPVALRDSLLPKLISGALQGKAGTPYVAAATP